MILTWLMNVVWKAAPTQNLGPWGPNCTFLLLFLLSLLENCWHSEPPPLLIDVCSALEKRWELVMYHVVLQLGGSFWVPGPCPLAVASHWASACLPACLLHHCPIPRNVGLLFCTKYGWSDPSLLWRCFYFYFFLINFFLDSRHLKFFVSYRRHSILQVYSTVVRRLYNWWSDPLPDQCSTRPTPYIVLQYCWLHSYAELDIPWLFCNCHFVLLNPFWKCF